jgi:hypothetical protein
MSWVRLDDAFPSHRKVRRLSDAAFRMHVSALCWSSKYLTDGHISTEDISMVTDLDDRSDPEIFHSVTKELVQRGLWHDSDHPCPDCPTAGEGWVIHNYLDLNPSSDVVQKQRQLATDRQRRSRERRHGVSTDTDTTINSMSRRDNPVTHGPVTAPHSHSHSPTQERKHTAVSDKPKRVRTTDDPNFDKFWNAYPRKEAKGAARRAWTKAITKTNVERIIAAAENYATRSRGQEPRFIAHASTWLNSERWDDQPPARTRPAPSGNFWTN